MDEAIRKKNNAFFRQLFFLAALIGLGFVIFSNLKFFVGSFLGAITIYIVIRNLMFTMVEKRRIHKWLAALILVVATGAVLGVFFWFLVKVIGSGIPSLNLSDMLSGINRFFTSINVSMGRSIIPDDIIEQSNGLITKAITGILNTTYSFTANILMMIIVLYFMLASGRRMEAVIWKYLPFRDNNLCLLKREVKTMIYSNAVGIPLILVAQTLVSTLIYWLLGFDNVWFWGFLTAICGLLPIVGTALVFVPAAIYMATEGDLLGGAILLSYGLIIISNTDNVFRIILLRKVADTHPLIVIFGVLLGIPLFGFWGIIFGPLFISGFILLINIYYMEYGLFDEPVGENLCATPRKVGPKFIKKFANRSAPTQQPGEGE